MFPLKGGGGHAGILVVSLQHLWPGSRLFFAFGIWNINVMRYANACIPQTTSSGRNKASNTI